MNSVDAGGTFCDIEISREHFSIRDDGKGFASEVEIEDFFDTFGTPHEVGDATYGRYRMGRGQIMSFGSSVWNTNNFRMTVDLKPQKDQATGKEFSLGYDFEKVATHTKGCHVMVDLYDKLTPSAYDSVLREITDYVKYVNIPVKLNGKIISQDPASLEWDEETPDAYINKKGGGTLDVYNQGVLVCKMSQYIAGVSGVVVSKSALEVNFARNAVQSDCKIWKRILNTLKNGNMDELKRNKPLSESQRDYFARELFSGELTLEELGSNRIITDITNSHHPFSVVDRLSNYNNSVSIAERGDRVAEMAHTRKLAFVVTNEFAERFGARTPKELVSAINDIQVANGEKKTKLVPVDRKSFDSVISSSHEPVAEKELNKAERMALKALRAANQTMYRNGSWTDRRNGTDTFIKGQDHGERKISVGVSDTSLAWTDGTQNIWFERKMLRSIKEGHGGMLKLCNIMLHEYLHNEPSTGTHEHGVEFYGRYHDLTIHTDIIQNSTDELFRTVMKELKDDNKNISQRLTSFEDRVATASDKGIGSFEGFINPEPIVETSEKPNQSEPMMMAAVSVPKIAKPRINKEDENQIAIRF